jgi:excisionase family DNA binding protein
VGPSQGRPIDPTWLLGRASDGLVAAYPDSKLDAVAVGKPALLTPEEAAAIARCSVKTVRRAYASGVLTAYRRRGSRAVLLDSQDVMEWAQGEIVKPAARTIQTTKSVSSRQRTRKIVKHADQTGRAPKLGDQQRFDLSAGALRERRSAYPNPRS